MGLEAKGALISAKGNVPQAVFSTEAENNIFGIVVNPSYPKKMAGGSTGGYAVLVATGRLTRVSAQIKPDPCEFPRFFAASVHVSQRRADFQTNTLQGRLIFGTTGDVAEIIPQRIGPVANWVQDRNADMRVIDDQRGEYFSLSHSEWGNVQTPSRGGIIPGFPHILELCVTAERAL